MSSNPGLPPPALALRELRAEVAALDDAEAEPLTDTLARFLAAHYVIATKKALLEMDGGWI